MRMNVAINVGGFHYSDTIYPIDVCETIKNQINNSGCVDFKLHNRCDDVVGRISDCQIIDKVMSVELEMFGRGIASECIDIAMAGGFVVEVQLAILGKVSDKMVVGNVDVISSSFLVGGFQITGFVALEEVMADLLAVRYIVDVARRIDPGCVSCRDSLVFSCGLTIKLYLCCEFISDDGALENYFINSLREAKCTKT